MFLELSKARITVAVMFSVATGHIFFRERLSLELLVPALGVFLLACGSATLNQVQEWRTDARMERTRRRPIPSHRIRPSSAALVAVLLIAAGLNVLAQVPHHTLLLVGLGAFSVFWYNAVYVILKRVTAFAVVPGGLLGAIPPVMGWIAAGGVWSDPRILELAGLFFLWQIPHFWLLLQRYGKEYEQAGLRSPTADLAPAQFQRVTVAWILVVVLAGLVLAVSLEFGLVWKLLALVNALALGAAAIGSLTTREPMDRKLFLRINIFMLVSVILVTANALS